MATDKKLQMTNTITLILKLIEKEDMYVYQIIDAMRERSDFTFHLKAGTLYPILHKLEKDGLLNSYETTATAKRIRKYYTITKKGLKNLEEREQEWAVYYASVNKVLSWAGGVSVELA